MGQVRVLNLEWVDKLHTLVRAFGPDVWQIAPCGHISWRWKIKCRPQWTPMWCTVFRVAEGRYTSGRQLGDWRQELRNLRMHARRGPDDGKIKISYWWAGTDHQPQNWVECDDNSMLDKARRRNRRSWWLNGLYISARHQTFNASTEWRSGVARLLGSHTQSATC